MFESAPRPLDATGPGLDPRSRREIARSLALLPLIAILTALPVAPAVAQAGQTYKGEYALYKEAMAARDISKAMRHARRAYQLAETQLEPGSKTLAVLAFNLGAIYFELDRFRDAVGTLEEAVPLYGAFYGQRAVESLPPILKLARSYQQLYQWEASERAYVRAIQIIEGSRGRDDPQIADILGQLLRVASELGQPKRVRSYGLRALNILSETEGADPTQAAWIHLDLARNELEHGDYATGRKHIQAAVPILEEGLSPSDPKLGEAYDFLSKFYEAVGRDGVSRRYRKLADSVSVKSDATQ